MQLIKINEQIVSEDVVDESKYRDVFCGRDGANRRFKCFVIRKADAKNPAPSKRIKDNQGNEFPDHIELDFDSAFNYAKNATAPEGHLFNKKKGSTIAYLRFSTQEGNSGDENTGKIFDKCDPKFTLLFVNGKLSSESKKILDTLYVDTKNGNYVVDSKPKVDDDEVEKERISKQILQLQNSEIEKVSTALKNNCGESTWSVIPKEIKNYFCICDDVVANSEGKKLPKNGIIVQFERNPETGNIDYKKLSYFVDGTETNSTDLSEKQIIGSRQAIETLSAFYKSWNSKGSADKTKLPDAITQLKMQLRYILSEPWQINKPTIQTLKLFNDETSDSIIIEYNISENNVDYSSIKYIKNNEVIKTKDLSDIDEDSVVDVILKQVSKWLKLDGKPAEVRQNIEQNQDNAQDQANTEEQSQETSVETQQQNQQQSAQPQPLPANIQNELTPQDKKKPISYINAKNNELNVKKGDYAIGQDGKLRLIKRNDANYKTAQNGKAVRNLHLSKGLRTVLRNLELMEGRNINEADEDNERKTFDTVKKHVENVENIFNTITSKLEDFLSNEVAKAFFENDKENKALFDNLKGKTFDDAKAIILGFTQRITDIKDIEVFQADQNKNELAIINAIDGNITSMIDALTQAQKAAEDLNTLKTNADFSSSAVNTITLFNSSIENAKKEAEDTIPYLEQIEDTTLRGVADADEKKEKDQADKDKALEDGINAVIDYNSAPKNIKDILDSDSFKKEIEAYGATKTNPFIAFLLNAKNRPAIWSKLSVGIYGVIHNAVAHDDIELAYLMAENDPKLKCSNMLLTEDFYKHSAPEMDEYFKAREKLANKIGYTINPLTPNEEISMSNGNKVKLPEAGIALAAETASKVLFFAGKAELNPIKDINIVINNLFGGEEKERKKLSTDQEAIIKALAKQMQCKEDELASKKDQLLFGMNVLLNRAFNNIPLDIAKVKEYAKKVGIDENNLFKGIEQDPTKGGWRDFFDADNIDNEKTVNAYITTVANILNLSGAKQ